MTDIEPMASDGPDFHADHAAWNERQRDWEGDFYKLLGDQQANDAAFAVFVKVAAEAIRNDEDPDPTFAQPYLTEDDVEDGEDEGDEYVPLTIHVAPWKMVELMEAEGHVQDHGCAWGAEVIGEFLKFGLMAVHEHLESEDE